MTTSVRSAEDMVNMSLVRVGYTGRVGSLYDGSKQAKLALDIYAQTRDAVLRQRDWDFASTEIIGELLKVAPVGGYVPPLTWNNTYPLLPWRFEMTYPLDALKIRTVKQTPIFIPVIDPQPQIFDVQNDAAYTPSVKVVLCNIPNAIICYTRQITDPQAWEANYIEELAAALGRRLAPALMGLDAAKLAAADEQNEMNMVQPREQE